MLTNLIMWGSIIWIIPLVYFMQKNETKFKKNIVIGVTLPFEAREDTQGALLYGSFPWYILCRKMRRNLRKTL